MANAQYGKYKQTWYGSAAPAVDWDSDNIKVVLVSASYTVAINSDQFLSDISAPARIATSGNLSGKSHTNGVVKAANPTLSAVTGSAVIAAVIYKDTGSAATSPLIAYLDTVVGIPFTPSGADETITFDATNGIWN